MAKFRMTPQPLLTNLIKNRGEMRLIRETRLCDTQNSVEMKNEKVLSAC